MTNSNFKIYTSPNCHKCQEVKNFLMLQNVVFEELDAFSNLENIKRLAPNASSLPVVVTPHDKALHGSDLIESLELYLSLQ